MHGARIEARLGKHLGSAPALPYQRDCHYPCKLLEEIHQDFTHQNPVTDHRSVRQAPDRDRTRGTRCHGPSRKSIFTLKSDTVRGPRTDSSLPTSSTRSPPFRRPSDRRASQLRGKLSFDRPETFNPGVSWCAEQDARISFPGPPRHGGVKRQTYSIFESSLKFNPISN